jgi:Ca2+-binding RTX toxin-like protein
MFTNHFCVLSLSIAVTLSLTTNQAEAARKQRPSSTNYVATISGTSADDDLVGTSSSDVIDGLSGNDWLDGRAGNDILIGGRGADKFVLRRGGGNDIIADFVMTDSLATTDRVLLDYGTYSDILWFGLFGDGQTFTNFTNTATFSIHAADVNADGVMDTVIQADADSITILNYAPSQLRGYILFGG